MNPFKVYNSLIFRKFTELCNHHSNFRTFSVTLKWSFGSVYSEFPLLHQPQARTNLLFITLLLLILDLSKKWSLTICGLLHPTSFIQHHVFKVHQCWSRYQNFIPFHDWIISHCMYRPCFMYPFTSRWTFQCLGIVNKATSNVPAQVCGVICFHFFWVVIYEWNGQLYGKFTLVNKLPILF